MRKINFVDALNEAHIEEMRCLVETVTGRPASGHTAMAEAFAKAHPEA